MILYILMHNMDAFLMLEDTNLRNKFISLLDLKVT